MSTTIHSMNYSKFKKCGIVNKGQRAMENPEKLAIYGTQDEGKHNMCWTPQYAHI